MQVSEMVPYSWYDVTFQVPGVHRKPRQMRAQFLGTRQYTEDWTEVSFSLRPMAGTQSLSAKHITNISQAAIQAPLMPKSVSV